MFEVLYLVSTRLQLEEGNTSHGNKLEKDRNFMQLHTETSKQKWKLFQVFCLKYRKTSSGAMADERCWMQRCRCSWKMLASALAWDFFWSAAGFTGIFLSDWRRCAGWDESIFRYIEMLGINPTCIRDSLLLYFKGVICDFHHCQILGKCFQPVFLKPGWLPLQPQLWKNMKDNQDKCYC